MYHELSEFLSQKTVEFVFENKAGVCNCDRRGWAQPISGLEPAAAFADLLFIRVSAKHCPVSLLVCLTFTSSLLLMPISPLLLAVVLSALALPIAIPSTLR